MEIKTYDKLNSVTESANTNGNKDSNAMVNAGFAVAGIAATVLIASGPIGIVVGLGILGVEILTSDYIKNEWNSLD